MIETAYAKINLALHVRERLADGYHRIETLFAFAKDGDRLSVVAGDGLSLRVEGRFAAQLGAVEDNLVLKAARALRARLGPVRGAALILDKRLPVASGIGGGSADAAAALRLLARWWGGGERECPAIARALGADVPACLESRSARGDAKGDVLTPLKGSEGTPLLMVNPGVALSTADVFACWDGVDRGPLPDHEAVGRNDLQPAAIALAPEITDVLAALDGAGGAGPARMSGSGATCFALFATEAARDLAALRIGADRPDWWLLSSRLR